MNVHVLEVIPQGSVALGIGVEVDEQGVEHCNFDYQEGLGPCGVDDFAHYLIKGHEFASKTVHFGADWRPMQAVAAALDEGEIVEVEIDSWQILG